MNTIAIAMTLISTPLKTANAIEAAAFAVVCREAFDVLTLDRIAAACDTTLGEELPGVERPTGMVINFQENSGADGGFGMQSLPPAVRRFRAKADATQSWRLQAEGNLMIVTCFDYTNWTDVWATAKRYLTTMIEAVQTPVHVAEVGFQVVDKFIYPQGAASNEYSVNEIFAENCRYLTPKVQTAGRLWHVHQGWFEETQGFPPTIARTLHQLNLTNGDEQLERIRIATTIDHRGAVRFEGGHTFLQELSLPAIDGQEQKLELIFTQLKASNQQIIKQVLTPEKIRSIGMSQ